ncbi:SdrD B-like domain-containing protein [Curtobacterium sp. VKM Ac-2884]|uniref:SdrD B-like domain-containing protein n=1 Tax=Curtobacterium sp. VKM Ac-2884 TaxID=2783818 RepID=UPI00188C617D|nr:SdrD B-like domain-containing protein [Curtobacterium sp. VKM Ac-2884]MBF4605073.1 hypothetical protein [Curtobacterium sp. VKM Ac-2884]
MRSRTRILAVPMPLVALSVVLGLAGPAAAALPTPDEERGSGEPVPSPAAARIDVAVEIAKDGYGPFTPNDEPGGDSGDANGIVRTLDAVTYRVTMNSTGGPSSNETFTVAAPEKTSWAGLPTPCTGAGSSVSGNVLTCNLGTVAEGHAVAVPAVLNVSADRKNGDRIAVDVTGTADGAAPITTTSTVTTVSAAARYNLSKNVHASILRTDVIGPDGSAGLQLVYPIAVDWQPVVPGQGMFGFEKSAGRMRFTDDVSRILGDVPSNAVLWNGGQPVCGPNADTAWRMGGLPAGKGGGDAAVVDSGSFACEQRAPGDDVDVTITGTVTDPSRVPSKSVTNGPVVGGVKPYFVSGFISFWMPYPPSGTSVESVNTYTALQATSVSGADNFPGSTEPTEDNSAKRNVVEYAPGGVQKQIYRDAGLGTGAETGSAKEGDPWLTAGTVLRSEVRAWNHGLRPYDHAILCDTFDRDTQRLHRVGGRTAAYSTGIDGATIQYAAYDMPSPGSGQQQACGEGDGPWYDTPEDVPGGPDAVGAVRVTGDVPGGGTATLSTSVTTRDAPNGTRAHDFGHAWFGDRATAWTHDVWSDPELGAGPLSDSVIITENLARIQKKIVDPGHDADDTPDETSVTVPGNAVDYALYPTLTNGEATGQPSDVTVRDVLPDHVSYVAGSASVDPEIDTVDGDDGTRRQRLTWTLHRVQPNAPVDPITYTAAVSELAPAGAIRNVVEVASPSDASDAEYRTAVRAVQVITTGGVGVQKRALAPVVAVGDDPEWSLAYTNTDAAPIADLDVIDVLPHRGDTRNSSFHGSVGLARSVEVHSAAGETVTYTSAAPSGVELDGHAPSNEPGGATKWCDAEAFGADGCPAALQDVTAFRIQRAAPVAGGETITHTVAVSTIGERDGDRYTNRFGVRASNLALPVQSNPATVRVAAGAIGDRVWSDDDGDGLQDHGEPGIADVQVHLDGTDDRGDDVERDTTSDADGTYHFDGLRPGDYTVTVADRDDRAFTTEHVGDDPAADSDVDARGVSGTVPIVWEHDAEGGRTAVTRDSTVDAGVVPVVPGEDATPGRPAPDQLDGPAASSAAAGPGVRHGGDGALAFTGSTGLSIGIACAVLLVVVGALLLGAGRNRPGRR